MAEQRILVSMSVIDGAGKTASMPFYMRFDDATATLSAILTANAVLANFVDDIIDGQITEVSFTIVQELPAGLKGAPLAPSNVQETGLFTFTVGDTPYSFAIDLPTIAEAVQSQGVIPNAGLVTDFVNRVLNQAAVTIFSEPVSLESLTALQRSRVSFRKRR